MPDGGLATTEIGRKSRLTQSMAQSRQQSFGPPKMTPKSKNEFNFPESTETAVLRKKEENERRQRQQTAQLSQFRQLPTDLSFQTDDFDEGAEEDGTETEKKIGEEENEEIVEELTPEETTEDDQLQQMSTQAAAEQFFQVQQRAQVAKRQMDQLIEEAAREKAGAAVAKVRKQVKASIRRGVEEALQGLSDAIGTTGIGIVVTIVVSAFTLTDLNLQMFWGYYITKKKSFLFPALEWDPIPMPKIVSVKILHAGLVVLDIITIFMVVLLLALSIIIMFAPQGIVGGTILYITNSDFRTFTNEVAASLLNN